MYPGQFVVSLALIPFLVFSVNSADRSVTTYINSNDRIRLELSSKPMLRGPPGTTINLKLLLINEGGASNFYIHQESEDGFVGEIVDPSSSFLTTNMQQEISILRMRVPDRTEGTVLRTSFFAIRQKSWKRSPQAGEYHEYNNPDNSNIGHGNVDLASLSIDFLVTSDTRREFFPPVVSLHYAAQSYEETCNSEAGDLECRAKRWRLSVNMQDEEAGLSRPEIYTTSTDFGNNERESPLHYRMQNFPIGTREKQRVDIDVSCCMETISIQVRNTAGELMEMQGKSGGYGDVDSDNIWSDGLFIAFIVVAIIIHCLVVGLIIICIHVRRTRYNPVSQR